jgi:hypothetical protein
MEGMAGSAGSGRASIPEYIPKPGVVNQAVREFTCPGMEEREELR